MSPDGDTAIIEYEIMNTKTVRSYVRYDYGETKKLQKNKKFPTASTAACVVIERVNPSMELLK